MIGWGYIREIRPFNKSTPICLNRCFWAITSCPQRTRGIEILMGPDYGRRCRPVLMTDILQAKWPEKKKEEEEKNVPTCLQNKAEKKAFGISVTCVPLRALALLMFTCRCIGKGLYSKTHKHTHFFLHMHALWNTYLKYVVSSSSSFFFFFYKEQKENKKDDLKAKLNPKSGVCVCSFILMCNNTVCTMAIFSWLELDYIVIYVGFSAFFVYLLKIC